MKKYMLALLIIVSISNAKAQSSWQWQNPLPQGNNLNSVTFINNTTGFAAGDVGMIMKTTDSGESWSIQKSGTYNRLASVDFTDQQSIGYAVGNNGTILKTTNGGVTWIDRPFNNNEYYYCVNFPSDDKTG